jgi:hypothetical protein
MTAEISRRVTLGWVMAASASAFASATGAQIQAPQASPWNDAVLPPIQAAGYGQDPNLTAPSVPWPLTLDEHQRAALRIAADLMLPADAHSPSGGSLNLDAFVDEWISAPYPQQQQDRAMIVPGLQWLDGETTRRFGMDFVQADDTRRRAVFDAIAFRGNMQPGFERPVRFFARLRGLMLAGFYSLPEGIADIGYTGNVPQLGDYPGPSAEAMAHLNASLMKLGLKPVSSG